MLPDLRGGCGQVVLMTGSDCVVDVLLGGRGVPGSAGRSGRLRGRAGVGRGDEPVRAAGGVVEAGHDVGDGRADRVGEPFEVCRGGEAHRRLDGGGEEPLLRLVGRRLHAREVADEVGRHVRQVSRRLPVLLHRRGPGAAENGGVDDQAFRGAPEQPSGETAAPSSPGELHQAGALQELQVVVVHLLAAEPELGGQLVRRPRPCQVFLAGGGGSVVGERPGAPRARVPAGRSAGAAPAVSRGWGRRRGVALGGPTEQGPQLGWVQDLERDVEAGEVADEAVEGVAAGLRDAAVSVDGAQEAGRGRHPLGDGLGGHEQAHPGGVLPGEGRGSPDDVAGGGGPRGRCRRRAGRVCSSFVRARRDGSSMPVTVPAAAARRPRATATASSSSSSSGGIVEPGARR